MPRVEPDDWLPVGVKELEPAAWRAIRADRSMCIIAGPGAGKTELLAQRAAYLFETGLCRDPYRILAISFKKDAAANLAARVASRCSAENSSRFDSVTFDSFTKSILDRFRTTLPLLWKLETGYDVDLPNKATIRNFLSRVRAVVKQDWADEVAGIDAATFEPISVGSWRLPTAQTKVESGTEYAVVRWWMEHVRENYPVALSFTMINRLAELIQRTNVQVRRALKRTYPFLFVDECQDTTYAQYDFVKSAFSGGGHVLTAVGDEKQRIMAWAGARVDIFDQVRNDFDAEIVPLRCNYRSSPELVRIQQVFAKALDESAGAVESRALPGVPVENYAEVWRFTGAADEAAGLSAWLSSDLEERGLQPRDYVLLVRQLADKVEGQLREAFASRGVRIRNESRLAGRISVQDLLAEPLTWLVMGLLRLCTRDRDPDSWCAIADSLMLLRGIDPYDADSVGSSRQVEIELSDFIDGLREQILTIAPTPEHCSLIVDRVLDFLTLDALAQTYPEYRLHDNLDIAVDGVKTHLAESSAGALSWTEALDTFEGIDSVPLMTIHKSKGLEFDTVLVVGLDDEMWWSFKDERIDGLAAFYVALSRAKRRFYVTHCVARGGRAGVKELFDLLTQAGVRELDMSGSS